MGAVPDGTALEMAMKSKLTLKKETLHLLATPSRRDGAALAGLAGSRTGAHDATAPTSLTSVWTQPW
jgi:hypothetical protein